ncbi:hypothetical protein K9N50_12585 [bacterium]|nr:hypothetical protein [bacterium]
MNKKLVPIAIIIIGVIIFVVSFNTIKENLRPLAMSPDELETAITEKSMTEKIVLAELNGEYYHKKTCTHTSGPVEKIAISLAEDKGLVPCPYCCIEDEVSQ